jgi:gamma-glutamylcyclotransferase (GGCT)/AIG2-like uncharacterized protein YtfP
MYDAQHDQSHLFPPLQPSQYAVLEALVETGHVLTVEGEVFLGRGDCYRVFDALEDAERYMQERIEARPDCECVLYDGQQQHIKVVRNTQWLQQRPLPVKKRPWWKFW